MINVLLVDVDIDNIKNFRNFLKTNYPNLKSIKSVTDHNKNIYDITRAEKPDLIVGDIKFFGINSYSIIRNIYEMFPEVRMILYGTYVESDYLKRSLDFGVINYMFKPVKPVEFKKAMDNALNIFDSLFLKRKEEDSLKNEYFERIKLFEDKFLNNVLNGFVKNDDELYRSFHYFNMQFFDNFCVCIVRVDYFKKIILTLSEMEKHMLIFKILNIINQNIEPNSSKATITNFNSIAIIMSGQISLDEILSNCAKIRNIIYEKMQIRVTTGIGRIYAKPADIFVSYKEAEAALRYRFHVGYNSIIPICFVEPENNVTYRYPLEKEHKLVYAAVIGEYEYCYMLLNEITASLREAGELPDNLIPKIILNILISISRYAGEQNILSNNQFSNFFSFKEGLEIRGLEEAYEFLNKAIKNFCDYVLSVHEEKDNNLFEEAKKYASKYYYESKSVLNAALKIGTTADYLNNLFIKRLNKSFAEYIVERKVQIAKQLMQESDSSDEVIAIKAGFEDSKKFRATFKHYENIFPHEYREKYGY
ncbi:MAG: helix-turn-helix domain-containing protein [Clostridiales bacterium]|nr:helix-turn-helix domain-containing protein [Clostridiales bacterium]